MRPMPPPDLRRPHLDREDWLYTPAGDPRGYMDAHRLTELWFHTGTNCNLRCPFCLEGSKPGDNRIEPMGLDDAAPFMDEGMGLGVEQFSFTGGEPFLVDEFVEILEYALDRRPCLVLTNATEPLMNRIDEVLPLREKPHPVKFRVSLDYPDAERHDRGRGPGNFDMSLDALGRLHGYGFDVSIARQTEPGEDRAEVDGQFHRLLARVEVPDSVNIVSFPDFLIPGEIADVPAITEDCMTRYQTAENRDAFMCRYTRFVLKMGGRMRVYACTLVDDDADYDLGDSLAESLNVRVMLRHHRCYACFAYGASCSES